MNKNRLSRGVVSLAASAITAVYAAGYIHTAPADAAIGEPVGSVSVVATAPAQSAPVVTASPAASTASAQSSSAAPTQTNSGSIAKSNSTSPPTVATPVATATSIAQKPATPSFHDGTYTGVGSSRRGNIQVSLVVQNGRISAVNITGATTQYPTRVIAALPAEVVSRQSAQVDTTSGATYSSLAFRGAVQQALQRAQA